MAYAPPDKRVYIYLTNSAGEKQANKHYGSTSASANGTFGVFWYSASVDTYIHRLVVFIEDTKGMEPEEYGNLGGALSAGYSLEVWNSAGGSALLDLCDGLPITTNAELGALSYDVSLMNWTNTTNEVVVSRLTFSKAGEPLWLAPGQIFRLSLGTNDLSGLIDHRFQLQGIQAH